MVLCLCIHDQDTFCVHGEFLPECHGGFIMKALVRSQGEEDRFYIESAAVSSDEVGNAIYPLALPRGGVSHAHPRDCGFLFLEPAPVTAFPMRIPVTAFPYNRLIHKWIVLRTPCCTDRVRTCKWLYISQLSGNAHPFIKPKTPLTRGGDVKSCKERLLTQVSHVIRSLLLRD